jgi:hypothetical protein
MSSLRNCVALLFVVPALLILGACGGSSKPSAPPTGGFTVSDLNGTYVFSTTGFDSSASAGLLAAAGTFSANGNGSITGGTVDVNGTDISLFSGAISGGGYTMTADGRGTVTLNGISSLPNGNLVLDFVLTSNSHGLVTEFDGDGSGSGTLDLQSSATLSGSYAFNLTGVDSGGNLLQTVGSFTLNDSGTITAGVEDFNDNHNFNQGSSNAFTLTGAVAAGTPGTATLSTSSDFGPLGFDVYPIDGTHMKFIETTGPVLLAGDAFTQQGTALPTTSTTFVYAMSDFTIPVSVGGLLPIDGQGNISNGLVDVNDNGNATVGTIIFNGTYAAAGSVGGRTFFNVSGFDVANQFVGYPTTNAGVQLLESDDGGELSGVAFAQSTTASLTASQGYAMNLNAINLSESTKEDDIAEFATNGSSGFNGFIDINDQGSLDPQQKYNGTYSLDSPADGRGEFTNSNYNLGIFYAIDNSTLLFLDAGDNIGLVGTGVLQLQNGTQSETASHVIVPHPVVLSRAAGARLRSKKK